MEDVTGEKRRLDKEKRRQQRKERRHAEATAAEAGGYEGTAERRGVRGVRSQSHLGMRRGGEDLQWGETEPRRSQSSMEFHHHHHGDGSGVHRDSGVTQKGKSWHNTDDVYSNGKREDVLLANIVRVCGPT